MADLRTPYLRLILLHAAEIHRLAGLEAEARKLAATPVNVGARLACVFRVLRNVEQSTRTQWGVARLGPTLPGRAMEVLTLVRCATVTALADSDPELWLVILEERARMILHGCGGRPSGTIEDELEAMEDDDVNERTEETKG